MKIHLPTKQIFTNDDQAYVKYHDLTQKAEPIATLVWSDYDIYPFQYTPVPDGWVQTDTLVNNGDHYTFAIREKTPEELAAENAAWREMLRVTPKQCRIMLHRANLLTTVEGIIATLDAEAKLEWEWASYVSRTHPLVAAVAAQAGLTEEQLDAMFVGAQGL